MSDISIPGLSSRYNTETIIEDLVAAERIRLDRMQDRIEGFETERTTWRQVNSSIGELQRSARSLYGFENPFSEKIASSSNTRILEARADRQAMLDSYSVVVRQVASADRFLTPSLPGRFRVGAGTYTFAVGDDTVSLRYKGGSVQDFARRLSDRGKGLLRASTVRDTADTRVLMIESLKTGSANRLEFRDDARSLALETGMLRQGQASGASIDPAVALANPRSVSGAVLDPSSVLLQDGTVRVRASSSLRIPFDSSVPVNENTVLEYTYRTVDYTDRDLQGGQAPGYRSPGGPGAEFQGISVQGESVRLRPQPDASRNDRGLERRDVLSVLSLEGSSGERTGLPDIRPSASFTTVRLSASQLPATVSALLVNNDNTHRDIELGSIRLYNPDETGGLEPVNPTGLARDAIVEFRGITATRPGNTIDDLVDGVTLTLNRASSEPVDIDIEPDTEAAKDGIIRFVFNYNQLLSRILVLTSDDPAIIDELDYLDSEQREEFENQLGTLRGDMSLTRLKSRLQTLVSNPYPTRDGADLRLLSQIGISTNASSGREVGAINFSKLRGYLEIDEEVLDRGLATRMEAVRDLFGSDSSGDLVTDTGAAKTIDEYVTPYIRSGGLVGTRISGIERQISSTEDQVTDYQEYLADYESKLRRQYGIMESTLNQLERSSREIDNLGRQQNGNR